MNFLNTWAPEMEDGRGVAVLLREEGDKDTDILSLHGAIDFVVCRFGERGLW